jgi:hypothetical protein
MVVSKLMGGLQVQRLSLEALLLLVAVCRLASLSFQSLVYDKVLQSLLVLFLFVGMGLAIFR